VRNRRRAQWYDFPQCQVRIEIVSLRGSRRRRTCRTPSTQTSKNPPKKHSTQSIHAAILMTDRETDPQRDRQSWSRLSGKAAAAEAASRPPAPPAKMQPPVLPASLTPLKRKASFDEEDDDATHDCDGTTKGAPRKTAKNEIPSGVVAPETPFQHTLGVFEQRTTDLEHRFTQWLKSPCMSSSPRFVLNALK